MNIEQLPARHWEEKATEALDQARGLISAEARRLMREVARRYRQMANIAAKRGAERAR